MKKFPIKFIRLLTICFLFFNHSRLYAHIDDNGVPTVGKPCPNFTLNDLINSNKSSISPKDFKGKWLMIDFWDIHCTSCVESMPETSRLQQIYKDKLQVILLGINNKQWGSGIKEYYLKLQKRLHLQLLAAFDSILYEKWDVPSVPHVIMVNPEGIVRVITGGFEVDSAKMQELIDGKNPEFRSKSFVPFDANQPLLTYNNGGADTAYMYRSLLTHYNGESYEEPEHTGLYRDKNKIGFQATCLTLAGLYRYAFAGKWSFGLDHDSLLGKISSELELDITDSSLFLVDWKNLKKNFFNYSLYVPASQSDSVHIMKIMQRELKNCFGYDAQLEDREVPYWSLTVRKDTMVSLRSTDFVAKNTGDALGLHANRLLLNNVLISIASRNEQELPFINETGMDYPVHIDISALMSDLPEVQKELRKNGLELTRKKKWMKVIVIRDPKE